MSKETCEKEKKKKIDRNRKRRKDERSRTFGLHPSSIICLSCRCGRKKGRGKKKKISIKL